MTTYSTPSQNEIESSQRGEPRIVELPEGYLVNGQFSTDLTVAREQLEEWQEAQQPKQDLASSFATIVLTVPAAHADLVVEGLTALLDRNDVPRPYVGWAPDLDSIASLGLDEQGTEVRCLTLFDFNAGHDKPEVESAHQHYDAWYA